MVKDVADFIEAEGLAGPGTDWQISHRRLFEGEDRMVVVTEDGGLEPEIKTERGIGSGALEEPVVQIRVRGRPWHSDEAAAKLNEIKAALHSQLHTTIGSGYYLRVKAQTAEPVFIGFDIGSGSDQGRKGRPEFTMSFRCLRRVAG